MYYNLPVTKICEMFKITPDDIDYMVSSRRNKKHEMEYARIKWQPWDNPDTLPLLLFDDYYFMLKNKEIIGKQHIMTKAMEMWCDRMTIQEIS